MDKHYYLLQNKVDYKSNSTIDVVAFEKKTEATKYKNELLKKVPRQVELDEANYGVGNPNIYLVVNDNELVYTVSRLFLKDAKLTNSLKDTYKIVAKKFNPDCTKSNFEKVIAFLNSIPNKTTSTKKIRSRKPNYVILYDENWNPIGCMKEWNT